MSREPIENNWCLDHNFLISCFTDPPTPIFAILK